MTYLKVYDSISKIERQVTQKAYEIITKNKRNPRYKFLAYVDETGQEIGGEAPVLEKKTEPLTEPSSPAKSAEAVADKQAVETESPAEGITVIRKKPGPKSKQNAKE